VVIPRGTTHEEHNEGDTLLEIVATFVVPAGAPLRLPAEGPAELTCG
jgi:hypothetical protein